MSTTCDALRPPDTSSAAIAKQFLVKWTPRLIVATLAGYYSLGLAYDFGVMAVIDRVAIYILKNSAGYIGVGALMPTIQWYTAWGVRTAAALAGGILYDLAEKIGLFIAKWVQEKRSAHPSLIPENGLSV